MSEHRWSYCNLCQTDMIICGACGNNCCNGGTGDLPDGSRCGCESAYAEQARGWDAEHAHPAPSQPTGEPSE